MICSISEEIAYSLISGQNKGSKTSQKATTGNQNVGGAVKNETSNMSTRKGSSTGLTVKALYDYTAADKDEVLAFGTAN